MGNKQQKQEQEEIKQQEQQELFFQYVQKKMGSLVEQFSKVKQIQNHSLFEIDLITNISQGIDTLNKYLDNSKIYVTILIQIRLFLWAQHPRKSTFINALLGQQLLPSRNQDCTKSISSIEHQNINDGNTQILINEKEFISLEKAYSELKTIRDSPNMDKINIKTHSYFHTTLSKDLQNRVIFIDTPGIKLTDDCSDEKYLQHFGKINQQIELDQYSKRINVWVSDYTTFDRDKKIQKKILESLKIKVEQNQQQQNQDNNQIEQSIGESQLFYIINKYDQSNTEDKPIQQYIQEIKDVFNSGNIFKISALNALHYNTMNYGTQDANDYFINQFYKDNKEKIMNFTEFQAREHCNNNIKNNYKIMKNQDFNEFISKMSLQIKNVMFYYLFNDLNQKIQYLKFGEEFKEAKQKLTQLHKNTINQFWSNYDKQNIDDYNQQLLKQKNAFTESIIQLLSNIQNEMENQQPIKVIIYTFYIHTIADLDVLNSNVLQKICQSKDKLLHDLTSILQQQQQTSIIIEKCQIIFQLMQECIYEQKKQFVQKQAQELTFMLGIKVNQCFYERASAVDRTRCVTLSSIVESQLIFYMNDSVDGLSSCLQVINLGGAIIFWIGDDKNSKIAPIINVVKASVFTSSINNIVHPCSYGYLKFKFLKNLKQKLNAWNQNQNSLNQDLVEDYFKIYDNALVEISNVTT